MVAVVCARPPRGRAGIAPVALAVLLIGGLLVPAGRAGAQGPAAADLVAAATAAYPGPGLLAVAVARQQVPVTGVSIAAAEARAARDAGYVADNGAAAERPFPSASMVKLYLAEDILHRARTGRLTLGRSDFVQLQAMIRHSDDPAASALWVRFGGARAVTDVADRYGLTGTAPPSVPGQWGQATTTARDLARFLARLPMVAHPADAGALLVWMRTATPLAADGFDQRFGLFGTAPGLPGVKQGWMCCVGGTRHLHSVAVVGRRVVVLLSEVPLSVGYDAGRAALTAAAAAIPLPHLP
jgi:Beta-lactamase enzyme family